MRFELEYSSRRSEVMKLYWRSWRRGLWKIQARIFAGVAAGLLLVLRLSGVSTGYAIAAALLGGLISIAWLPLFPLWKFKPQRRTLTVDAEGLKSTIGDQSGERRWSDFAGVAEVDGAIMLVGTNGNAFIVPPRAFPSDAMRLDFLAFVRRSVAAGREGASPQRPIISQ